MALKWLTFEQVFISHTGRILVGGLDGAEIMQLGGGATGGGGGGAAVTGMSLSLWLWLLLILVYA